MAIVEYRRAHSGDVKAIVDLVNRAFVVERSLFEDENDRTNESDVRDRLARGAFLLGEQGGVLMASVYVEIRGARGYVGMLAVHPDAQGGGRGRALMAAAEDYCRRAGCTAVDLSVIDQRRELPAFYRRLGYLEHGTAPYAEAERMRVPCRLILMTKLL
jgi:ribosomal protein S18 acetylase RimI-like enzyme